jgi:predicted transcriptional regulator
MIITTFVGIIIDQQENRKRELITKLVTIFRNKSNTETLLSLASHRAATMRTLLNDIDLSEMSVNRSLNILKHLGLIHRAGKTKQAKSLGGPKPTVWAIHGYKPDDITQAIVTHQRLSSPLYSESEKATQLIIDDYIASKNPKEVTREEIWPLIKKLNPGFSIKEFGDRVLSNLQKQGIKVWR